MFESLQWRGKLLDLFDAVRVVVGRDRGRGGGALDHQVEVPHRALDRGRGQAQGL